MLVCDIAMSPYVFQSYHEDGRSRFLQNVGSHLPDSWFFNNLEVHTKDKFHSSQVVVFDSLPEVLLSIISLEWRQVFD